MSVPSEPLFLFVNYFDAHHNYIPAASTGAETIARYDGVQSGRIHDWVTRPDELANRLTEADLAHLKKLYAAEVSYTDAQVGRLLQAWNEIRGGANTIVIVFGDHGEQFLEHGGLTHSSLHKEVVHVPLIVAGNAIPTEERRELVSLIDLLPTLLGRLHLPSHEAVQGVDLFADRFGGGIQTGRYVYAEVALPQATSAAVIGEDFKLIRDELGSGTYLYSRINDPYENCNLSSRLPLVRDRMEAMLTEGLPSGGDTEEGAAEIAAAVSDNSEEREKLRGLGYVR
jgi:arylsulfatase A-like enzyme